MPLPILPALIAGAVYLIYSGFREEGPVATPNPHAGAKRGPGRPKGTKAKPKVNVPRETSKSEAAPKPKPPAAGTKPTPKPKPKPRQSGTMPEPKPEPKPKPEPPAAGTKPEPEPKPEPRRGGTMPENEKEDDVPRETSPETGTMSDSET